LRRYTLGWSSAVEVATTAVLYLLSLHATLTFVAALKPRAIIRAMLRRIEDYRAVLHVKLNMVGPRARATHVLVLPEISRTSTSTVFVFKCDMKRLSLCGV